MPYLFRPVLAGFLLYILYVTFGWEARAFFYHNLGLAVSGPALSFGVPLSQNIENRHLGQLLVQSSKEPWAPSYQNAEAAGLHYFLSTGGGRLFCQLE